MSVISTPAGLAALQAGFARAAELGVACSIAIVDAGRNPLIFARDEKAILGSAEIARNKAFTAASFRKKTSAVSLPSQPGGPLYGLEVSGDRPFVIFGGGVPVLQGEVMIGAVGVSGGSVADDEAIADAVAEAVLAELAGAHP